MKKLLLFTIASYAWAACTTDSRGICVTGLTAVQDNLLGPLTPAGSSPWIYGDLMEKAVIDYMVPLALAEAPVLPGSALSGTVSWSGGNVVSTTVDLTGSVAVNDYLAFAWASVDGAGTGRAICPVNAITSSTITCGVNIFAPNASGITAYKMSSTPGPSGYTFLGWDPQNQQVNYMWNYYDVAIGLYRYYYRSLDPTYLTYARQFADIHWQWTIDHGYGGVPIPRTLAMVSQFFRALDGHSERFPYLYNEISNLVSAWADISTVPTADVREAGYILWDFALGAKTDPDATRHTQYCSWLSTYTAKWGPAQYADGSWGTNVFYQNQYYVSAPKSFTPPFLWVAYPWNLMSAIKGLEAAYESLNDTTAQGCNNTTLAASTLTVITNAITYQNNYGRDTTNRGIFYEVNSPSDDQAGAVIGLRAGTVSATLTSTAIVGTGTNWQTAGYCDGTHYIGLVPTYPSPMGVYKLASCTDDTHATLSPAWGLYSETGTFTAMPWHIAPAASSSCGGSSATYCYTGAGNGDRSLTRTVCGGMGWLYAQTLNATYKTWADECISATLGGPTAGPTSADGIGSKTLPCSGPACDGFVGDTGNPMRNCGTAGSTPCMFGNTPYSQLLKPFGEAFGAPGIDNTLAWRNWATTTGGPAVSGKAAISGKMVH